MDRLRSHIVYLYINYNHDKYLNINGNMNLIANESSDYSMGCKFYVRHICHHVLQSYVHIIKL